MIIAEASAGAPAILTAIGGVCVSIFTVYRNAKRQDKATQDNTDLINNLTNETKELTKQVIQMKELNAALSVELTLLKARIKIVEPDDEPKAKPKKAKKKA